MAVKIKIKGNAVIGGGGQPDWYRHETEQLVGVTALPSNPDLGINEIKIYAPTEAQAETGMVVAGTLVTVVGEIRVTIYQSQKQPDTIYLRAPQSREEDEETGEMKYYDEVKLSPKVVAQTLRFVETQIEFDEIEATEETAGESGNADNPFGNVVVE